MPAKKKTKISNVKAEASAVKQVVNVRVGDQIVRRKTVRRARRSGGRGGGSDGGLAIFSRPLPIATQSLGAPSQAPILNEYNELLRTLAAERRERLAAAPPLAPNTEPLTTNMQRNELLSRPDPRTPLTPIVQAFAVAEEAVVDKETYDDPLTNENMFVGASRLAEKLAPRLPVSNFNYDDVIAYDDENEREQDALFREAEAVSEEAKRKAPKSASKYEGVSKAYDAYVEFLTDANARYIINEPIKARRSFGSQAAVKREIDRIQTLVLQSRPRKAAP